MSKVGTSRPITRDDIESKLRELQGGSQRGADAARGVGKAAGAMLGIAAVGIAYMVGRRRGRRRRTIVEVRRV